MCIYTTILNVSITCSYDSIVFGSVNAMVETGDKRWKIQFQEFLSGLVVRILGSQLMWLRFNPWLGNKDPTSHTVQSKRWKSIKNSQFLPSRKEVLFILLSVKIPASLRCPSSDNNTLFVPLWVLYCAPVSFILSLLVFLSILSSASFGVPLAFNILVPHFLELTKIIYLHFQFSTAVYSLVYIIILFIPEIFLIKNLEFPNVLSCHYLLSIQLPHAALIILSHGDV